MPKRTGQIIKIKNGKWQARVQWINFNKKRKSESRICKSKEEATEALKAILKALKAAESEPRREYKIFDELFDAYLEIVKPTVREQTYFLYERIIKSYLRNEFGSRPVDSLTPHDIEKFYVELQKRLSAETIFKIHTQLKKSLKKARLWKWITENPIEDIKPPKRIKNPKDTLTPDELNLFFAACPTFSIKAQWVFFALTGARPQEVFAVRWSDVDFSYKTFTVNQVLVQTKQVKKFDEPKTEKSKRVLPLSDALLTILKKHKIEQNLTRLKTGELWNDLDLIFPTSTGKPQRLSNIGEKVTKIRTDAGIDKNITPHGFRHSFATLCRQNGGDLKVISEYLGHSSIKTTADIYSHVNLDEKAAVSSMMSGLILRQK